MERDGGHLFPPRGGRSQQASSVSPFGCALASSLPSSASLRLQTEEATTYNASQSELLLLLPFARCIWYAALQIHTIHHSFQRAAKLNSLSRLVHQMIPRSLNKTIFLFFFCIFNNGAPEPHEVEERTKQPYLLKYIQ